MKMTMTDLQAKLRKARLTVKFNKDSTITLYYRTSNGSTRKAFRARWWNEIDCFVDGWLSARN